MRRIGIEESVRFFLWDGLRMEAPHLELLSADAVTVACRAYKSPAEIALMQRATDISRGGVQSLHLPAARRDVPRGICGQQPCGAQSPRGHRGDLVSIRAGRPPYPHGSKKHPHLTRGDVVLMDGKLHGRRLFLRHQSNNRFRRANVAPARDLEPREGGPKPLRLRRRGSGWTCGDVDAAARKVITDAGFGPGYNVPGLPHRTGHGIGLDIHEWHPHRSGQPHSADAGDVLQR